MSLLLRAARSRFVSPRASYAFHTNCIARDEWTKASLRRMKKPELVRLAKENKLDISGTKNDIIIQLLSHQTAKIVGSHSFVRQTAEKTEESRVPTTKSAIEKVNPSDEVDADADWVNAFEMKVAQRGSRKPLVNSKDHFTSESSVSKPHRFNDMIKNTIAKPAVEEQEKNVTPVVEQEKLLTPAIDVEQVDGMDAQWVEAFDLKVGSRGARSHSQFADTLTPSPKPTITSQIKFITKSDKREDDKETATIPVNEADRRLDDSSRDTWINTVVGSSMFLWYFSGEDGSLSKIWHFLSSS